MKIKKAKIKQNKQNQQIIKKTKQEQLLFVKHIKFSAQFPSPWKIAGNILLYYAAHPGWYQRWAARGAPVTNVWPRGVRSDSKYRAFIGREGW